MRNDHSTRRIIIILLVVLFITAMVLHILQSNDRLHYLYYTMLFFVSCHMWHVKRSPVAYMITGLVYVRAVGMVIWRAVVEGGMVVRRDWGVCLWKAKQLI